MLYIKRPILGKQNLGNGDASQQFRLDNGIGRGKRYMLAKYFPTWIKRILQSVRVCRS